MVNIPSPCRNGILVMESESRRHPKYDIMAQIRVKRGRVNYIMDIGNIRRSGAFVSTDSVKDIQALRLGQILEMDIFDAGLLENIRIKGEIMRIVGNKDNRRSGFGVKFTEIDEKAERQLRDLLAILGEPSIEPPPLPTVEEG